MSTEVQAEISNAHTTDTKGEPPEQPLAPEVASGAASAPAPAAAAEPIGPDAPAVTTAEGQAGESETLRQEIENLGQQLAEHKDRLLRAQAEMENLRKRTARDIENAHKYALERFVKELLPVLDSLELGLSSAAQGGVEAFREGMDLTLKKLQTTLEMFGVTALNPGGEKFNPEKHEAVTLQEQADAKSGTVITVMQKGYELNGRLVRPAMVIVAK
jgi:molecular chaperone GrpE